LVGWDHVLISSQAELFTEDTWYGNNQGGDEEDTHYDECKDPLEGKGLSEELANPNGSGQDAECKAHGIILEDNEEEETIDQDTPDSNVSQDTSWQAVGIDSNSPIPV